MWPMAYVRSAGGDKLPENGITITRLVKILLSHRKIFLCDQMLIEYISVQNFKCRSN